MVEGEVMGSGHMLCWLNSALRRKPPPLLPASSRSRAVGSAQEQGRGWSRVGAELPWGSRRSQVKAVLSGFGAWEYCLLY